MVKNNPLISFQYAFYNYLYYIKVSERYSYRKIFGRIAPVLLKESPCKFSKLDSKRGESHFQWRYAHGYNIVTGKSARENIKEKFDSRCF